MKKLIITIAFCLPIGMQAQNIDEVLRSIEQNNKELQSQTQLLKAQKMENRTANNLPDPTAVSHSRCSAAISISLSVSWQGAWMSLPHSIRERLAFWQAARISSTEYLRKEMETRPVWKFMVVVPFGGGI